MDRLEEAEKYIRYVEFLLGRENAKDYIKAMSSHLLKAANLLVSEYLKLDGNVDYKIVQQKLVSLSEQASKEFAQQYLKLWKLQSADLNSIRESLQLIKEFMNLLK